MTAGPCRFCGSSTPHMHTVTDVVKFTGYSESTVKRAIYANELRTTRTRPHRLTGDAIVTWLFGDDPPTVKHTTPDEKEAA